MDTPRNPGAADNRNADYDEAASIGYETGIDAAENIDDIADNEAGDGADYEPGFDTEEGDYAYEPDGIFSTPMRVIALVSLALMLFLVAGVAAWLLGKGAAASAGPPPLPAGVQSGVRVGALPPDFQLNDAVSGQPVRLSSLRGKPVWVNFWASWCAPCKAEMPEMKQRYAKYKDMGLVIVGVDLGEDSRTVKLFTRLKLDLSARQRSTGRPTVFRERHSDPLVRG